MVFAACIFLLSSAGCGWAPNMPFFIAARALSGFGAGGMNGLSFIIVADTFPLGKSDGCVFCGNQRTDVWA